MLNVLLQRIEVVEELAGFRRVMTMACKVHDPILLLDNMSLKYVVAYLGNMPLDFLQMEQPHRAIHNRI